MTCNTSAVAVCCSNASRVSVDQPRVLHRDDRLRREILQQRDLLLGERPHFLAVYVDRSEQGAVVAQRHRQYRPHASNLDHRSAPRVIDPVGGQIRDMDNPFARGSGGHGCVFGLER